MKILVIGSAGFIGRHLMEQGNIKGYEMVGCDPEAREDSGHHFRCSSFELRPEDYASFDHVIFSAGVLGTQETLDDPYRAINANIVAPLDALDKIHKASMGEDLIFTYVTLGNKWLNPYSITKNCAADFVRMFMTVHGLNTRVAVCYNVFGPYQKWAPVKKIVPEFMTKILAGATVGIWGRGDQSVDMVYAPDLAASLLNGENMYRDGLYHYGSGLRRRVEGVAEDCATALGMPFRFERVGYRPGETGGAAISPIPIATQTPYMEALRITAQWYRDNYRPNAQVT